MKQRQVGIIGGGLAGLHAARRLQAAGIDYVLIEARDRLGGRILSVDQHGQPCDDGFDLGPSWYRPHMQPAMAELVAELELSAFCQSSDGDVIFERMSREALQRYRGTAQEQQSMRLTGGTVALVRALSRDLPTDRILLGARVSAMTLAPGGVELSINLTNRSKQSIIAQQVIAALPPRLLEATIALSPEPDVSDTERWRATPTWMAPHAKFFALYDRPFWRDAGLSGTAQSMVGPMVEIHDATTASSGAALFGFLGVAADQRALLGQDALARACLDQFARVFGADARALKSTLLKDWAADSLTATEADRSAAGHILPSTAPWVSGEWQERLSLAGSETSPSEAGYLAGAVTAAELVVAATLRRMAGSAR
ncbi:amine oxidase [Sphingobium lactosutens]|uniref:flavin monoamine oxidase family protein n=1 Tax=Sphingobium lactosutens TaxID=522773 RepID=UPI0015C08323|nr:FAD-dependent oxidoreductase [Sphingobium lactosutens]NWK99175.1 amine oxidase [Sphingobium lactosutens]